MYYLFAAYSEKKTAPSKKKQVKKAILLKKWMFFQCFVFPSPFLYYDLSFDMQKPSHVTNIHWKFHDFFLSGLGAIKVLHFTVRSEDGVVAADGSEKSDSICIRTSSWPSTSVYVCLMFRFSVMQKQPILSFVF